ncbi:hypothetical protein DFH09DRAFT_878978, partial [Mycena vulgaris]
PTIDSAALPSTLADEWAATTNNVLFNANGTTVQTPGPAIPGAFPEDSVLAPTVTGEPSILHAANAYLPAEEDVQRALTNVGQAAKAYLPSQVAGYFGGAS